MKLAPNIKYKSLKDKKNRDQIEYIFLKLLGVESVLIE